MKKLVQIVVLVLMLFPIAAYCTEWEPMNNPLSNTDGSLTGIWGTSRDDVYAVGEHQALGIILHFNGRSWSIQRKARKDFAGVWGSSKYNVYVGGTDIIGASSGFGYWHFRPQIDLSTYCFVISVGGICNDMLMTGYCYDKGLSTSSGFVIRYSRVRGARMLGGPSEALEYNNVEVYSAEAHDVNAPYYGFDGTIYDVWTYENVAYFVAGDSGMMKYNGRWMISIPVDTKGIKAIWGSDLENIFLAGKTGKIVRCNIEANPPIITIENPITDVDLSDVWGSSPNDVYAVGSYGTILHFDGKTWSQMDSGIEASLLGVWGESGGDVFAVGYEGTILCKKALSATLR